MSSAPEAVQVDFLILADRAEIVNGKMYMMGGGWDRIAAKDLTKAVSFSIAVGVLVPWHLTNEAHTLHLRIRDADANDLASVNAQFTVGRPPSSVQGQSFRSMVSIQGQWVLPKYGMYEVVASVRENEKRVTFFAHDGRG